MKALTLTTVVVGALLAADGAEARHDNDRDRNAHRDGYSQHHDRHHRRDDERHHRRGPHFNKYDVVRLDIPVNIRGDGRVHLRRLLRSYYNINTDHYRLKRVVIDNRAHRPGSARLRVGGQLADRTALERGRNHLSARGYSHGRWVLGLDNARVKNIRVVLEPRQRYAHRDYPRRWMSYSRY